MSLNEKNTSTAPLTINNICKSYGKQTVLDQISFALKAGETFGLIGLNGAGKTTLIKTVLQLTQADSGAIDLFDQPASQVNARANLAYLPEKFHPSKYLKGREYLEFALSYYGEKFSLTEAEEVVAALDLPPEKLSQKISSYSKGMGQKIGLAGSFLVNRPLLILDEPMSGLDPLARIRLKQKMQSYKKAGNTIFFSSHILSDIDEICDRIGIIHGGELRYIGTPEDFKKEHPAASLESSFLEAIAA